MKTHSFYSLTILLFLAMMVSGCKTSSTLTLTDGSVMDIEFTQSDSQFLYGVDDGSGKAVKLLRKDVLAVEYPGSSHVTAGAILTGISGAFALGGVGILATADGMEGILGIVLLVFGAAPTAAAGIPILIWGSVTQSDQEEKSDWQQAMKSIRPAPIVLSDGVKNHYGLGLSGRF
jgi:hypothetical protein